MPTPSQSKMAVKVFTEAFLLLWFRVVGMGPCSQASCDGSQYGGREMGASSTGLARRENLCSLLCWGAWWCHRVPYAHIHVTAACADKCS